jgi:hypothetical protein
MTDLLLKFPDIETAGSIGAELDCASCSDGEWTFATTHSFAIHAIGEHYISTGDSTEEVHPDGNFWAIVRMVDGIRTPDQLSPYIVERDESDMSQPQINWA